MADLHHEIGQVPVEAFCRHYLPEIRRSSALDSTHQTILQSEAMADGRWKDFLQPPLGDEDPYFQRLERIVNEICHLYAAQSNTKRTVKFACRSNNTTASEIEGGSFKSDGIFYLANSSVPPYVGTANYQEWFSADVVANTEFKLKSTPAEVHKNRGQVVGGATHYIANDPRRTHMYSLTVEEDSCRLWYYCRSHCVKSKAFSLSRNIRTFIHFVTSISFATEEELGFDTTIQRHRNTDNTIYYEYKLNHTVYKTLSPISEHSAAAIPGRGTRVWRVEDGAGTVCVLKDYWVDDVPDGNGQCITEDLILTEIYQRLEKLKKLSASDLTDIPEAEREVVFSALQNHRNYFVNISECETLGVTKDIYPEFRRCSVIEKEPISRAAPAQVSKDGDRSIGRGSPISIPQGSQVSLGEEQHPRSFLRKRHCRLLYVEECTAFYAIDNLEEAIQVLHDCVLALQLLYLAGFVHRDISPGNVLLYRHEGRSTGKLSDFEYAKPFSRDDQVARDPKTGTPGFISVEVFLQKYLFPSSSSLEYMFSGNQLPFHFNFLHDMDSVLWVTLYLFATQTLSNKAIDVTTEIEKTFILHFVDMCSRERLNLFTTPLKNSGSLSQLYAATYSSFSSPAGHSVFELLCDVQKSLCLNFLKVEQSVDVLRNARSYSNIYGPVRETIGKLLAWAKGLSSKQLYPVHYGTQDRDDVPPQEDRDDVPPLPVAVKDARKNQLQVRHVNDPAQRLRRKEPDDKDDGSGGEMTKRQRTDDDMGQRWVR